MGLEADLIIYVTAKSEPEATYAAWALPCVRDAENGRPFVGIIHFNYAQVFSGPSVMEYMADVTMHEVKKNQ